MPIVHTMFASPTHPATVRGVSACGRVWLTQHAGATPAPWSMCLADVSCQDCKAAVLWAEDVRSAVDHHGQQCHRPESWCIYCDHGTMASIRQLPPPDGYDEGDSIAVGGYLWELQKGWWSLLGPLDAV